MSSEERVEIPGTAMRSIASDLSQGKSDQRVKAKRHLRLFLMKYDSTICIDNESSSTRLLTESDVTKDFMERYAAYLIDDPRINSHSTAKNYFSATKNYIADLIPSLGDSLFKKHSTEWFKKIRKHYVKDCAARREPLVHHHLPVRDVDHKYLCNYMFSKDLHEECALQVLDWTNGGRIGEGIELLWRDLTPLKEVTENEKISCMKIGWYRGKTHSLTDTHCMLHAEDWQVCPFHSLARMVVLKRRTTGLIFPDLQSGVVTHMNTHMKAAYKHWKAEDDKEAALRMRNEELGIYPVEAPYRMKEGLTTHGNRAGCITHARGAGISDPPIQARCGLARSSRDQIDEYDSVTWESDSKVKFVWLLLNGCTCRLYIGHNCMCFGYPTYILWTSVYAAYT